jgi:thiamine biosynthesis protein ThiI
MISGGIDSPVAGYMVAKRGMKLIAVHYYSYPFTSEHAKQKVISLCGRLAEYNGHTKLYIVPFTEIQQEIHKNCADDYMITIMRRL